MIELKNVTKTYKNGTVALSDVSLTIQKGEFVFIVGESGAGKSTLLKLLLKEEDVTSGWITVGDFELSSMKKKDIPYYRRQLGVVFQDFRLFPDKTVYENVAFALRVIGERSSTIKLNVGAALSIVDLSDKAKCYPDELSGGEQQRVALARALANAPGIIIADEPTGNIDPRHSRDIMEMLIRIQRRYQKTVIVVTHDKELVDLFCQRVITIRHGEVIEDRVGRMFSEEEDDLAEKTDTQDMDAADSEASSPDLPTDRNRQEPGV